MSGFVAPTAPLAPTTGAPSAGASDESRVAEGAAEGATEGARPGPGARAGALLGALGFAALAGAGLLMWAAHGEAVFSDVVLAALAWCF